MNASQLTEELRILSNELRKRNAPLKESLEQCAMSIENSSQVPISSVLSIIEQATQLNLPRVNLQGIGIIHKLLCYHVLDSDSILASLKLLGQFVRAVDEDTQVKSMQTIMLVLNPSAITLTADLVNTIWGILIGIQGCKNHVIRNTAEASLRQLTNIAFDQLSASDLDSAEGKTVYNSCLQIFQNAIEMAEGTHSLYAGELQKQKPEGVDLLTGILKLSKDCIAKLPEFTSLLGYLGDRVLLSYISEDLDEGLVRKSIDCSVLTIQTTGDSPNLLETIVKSVNSKNQSLKLTSLAAISKLSSDQSLFLQLHNKNLLLLLLTLLSMELHSQTDVRLISETLSHLVESLAVLIEKTGIVLGETAQFPLTEEAALFGSILVSTTGPSLTILSTVASLTPEESLFPLLFSTYQLLINVSGTLNSSPTCDSFISSLTVLCLPQENSPLSPLNIAACNALLKVAHCLESVLDTNSWHIVLGALQRLDHILANTTGLQALAGALESLFTSTQNWAESSLLTLISALGRLTLELLATNENKVTAKVFALEKMTVVAQSNLNRVTLFWDTLEAYLDTICNSKCFEIRVLGLHSLSGLLIKVFKHFTEFPPAGTVGKWENWQKKLFLSLQNSERQDTQDTVHQCLFNIFQDCGAQLDRFGWAVLLTVLSKAEPSQLSFKCLQLVLSEFLTTDSLFPSLEKLLKCISRFAHSAVDLQQSVLAIAMYWALTKYLSQLTDQETLWWRVLTELKGLGESENPEIRHSAVKSLHTALTEHGTCLSVDFWQKLMHGVVLELFARISSNYFAHATITQEVPILEPPNFGGSPKAEELVVKPGKKQLTIAIPTDLAHPIVNETPKFGRIDVFRSDKLSSQDRDSIEKQWEETYHIYTQNLGKWFTVYLRVLEQDGDSLLVQNKLKNNWDVLMLRLKQGLHHGATNIILAVLQSSIELLSCEAVRGLFFAKWMSSWEIMTTLSNRLQVSQINIPTVMVSIILENLTLIISAGRPEPFQEGHLNEIFILLNCLLENSKNENTLAHCKLLPEQQQIFDFIEKLAGFILANGEVFASHVHFVLKYCKYDTQDSHSDAVCRRALGLLQNAVVKSPDSLSLVVPDILNCYEDLLMLRFNNEALMLMAVTSKGAAPLWLVTVESFVEMIDPLLTLNCWDRLIQVLEAVLNPSKSVLSQLSKLNKEAIAKQGESVDMQLMDYVTRKLIPVSMQLNQTLQWKLVALLDIGCHNYYREFHVEELSFENSMSSVCLAGLFKLAKRGTEPAAVPIAKRIVPVLINRCKELLRKFATEEKLLGQMPLPKGRIVEVLDLLQCLGDLEIPEGILEKPGPKAHLVQLFPELCDLITARDLEVKAALRKLFLELGNML